jgi:hypothetical protein
MPQSGRKRVLKIKFRRSDTEGNDSSTNDPIPLKAKGVNNVISVIPSFDAPNRPKWSPDLVRKVFDNRFGRARIVGGVPQKSTLNRFLGKLMRSRKVSVNKMSGENASLLNKRISDPSIVTKTLVQQEHVAPRFMSILIGKGRLMRHRVASQLFGRKVWGTREESARLPYARKLQLFQALLAEPLPFLDLHVRFGVSKQTMRRLVNNGLLTEVWGPKAIGVRFKLSKKGKIHLKELEAAARYESKVGEKDFIRLKNKPLP